MYGETPLPIFDIFAIMLCRDFSGPADTVLFSLNMNLWWPSPDHNGKSECHVSVSRFSLSLFLELEDTRYELWSKTYRMDPVSSWGSWACTKLPKKKKTNKQNGLMKSLLLMTLELDLWLGMYLKNPKDRRKRNN